MDSNGPIPNLSRNGNILKYVIAENTFDNPVCAEPTPLCFISVTWKVRGGPTKMGPLAEGKLAGEVGNIPGAAAPCVRVLAVGAK